MCVRLAVRACVCVCAHALCDVCVSKWWWVSYTVVGFVFGVSYKCFASSCASYIVFIGPRRRWRHHDRYTLAVIRRTMTYETIPRPKRSKRPNCSGCSQRGRPRARRNVAFNGTSSRLNDRAHGTCTPSPPRAATCDFSCFLYESRSRIELPSTHRVKQIELNVQRIRRFLRE